MDLDLRHLRAAVTVAQVRSFTRAAAILHVAQPSLSYTIQQLESIVGFRIFDRTTRMVSVTSDGELLLNEAKALLDQFEKSMARLASISRGETGSLRVGYLIGAALEFVPEILRRFTKRYPGVTIEVLEFDFSTPNGGLDTKETDVAIVRPPLGDINETQGIQLLQEDCIACVPNDHRFAQRSTVSAQELLAEPIVAAPGSNNWRDYWLLSNLRTEPPNVAFEAATFEAELQAVAFGHGLSVMPASAATYYARPGVRFVPITGLDRCEVSVVWRADSAAASVNFARIAHQVVSRHSARSESYSTL